MDTSPSTPDDTALDAARFCGACGRAVAVQRFCSHCGSPVEPAGPAVTALVPEQDHQVGQASTLVPAQPLATSPTLADAQPTEVLALSGPVPDELRLDDLVDQETPAPRAGSLRDRRTVLGATVLVLPALVVGGVLGLRYMGESDLRAALSASSPPFNATVRALTAAPDAATTARVAGEAEDAAGRVERALERLRDEGGRERAAVRAQLRSEQAVLLAVAQLADLVDEPLTTWGAAHDDLTKALAAEDETHAALAAVDSGAAEGIARTDQLLAEVTQAVGPLLVQDATTAAERVLDDLAGATSTADLRKLGDLAGAEQSGVAAAAAAVPEDDGGTVLLAYASGLDALGDLSRITGESAGSWTATRAALARSFGQLAASAGSEGGSVRVTLDDALDEADAVVAKAIAAIADWRAKTEAATKARAADGEALTAYTGSFRAAAKTYAQLREDLSAHLARGEDLANNVTYAEDYAFLDGAIRDRRAVRDLMVAADVPASLEGAHQAVVAAVDRSISAVQSAYDGLEQSQDCFDDCTFYLDTPGWQRFLSESDGISKAYAAAMTRWEAAVPAARAAITNRPLPAKPQV